MRTESDIERHKQDRERRGGAGCSIGGREGKTGKEKGKNENREQQRATQTRQRGGE